MKPITINTPKKSLQSTYVNFFINEENLITALREGKG
jgi:hypothetical protein